MPTITPTGSDARPEQKFKKGEGKYRKRRYPGIMKYQPHSREINEHWSEKRFLFLMMPSLMLLYLEVSLSTLWFCKDTIYLKKYVPHYYAPLLPSWCLQTLISRLVLVKRLSLQNVRLRGKKRGLGSLSINSTFRQINCSLFFFLRSTSQPVIITHLFPHHCGILSSSAPPPPPQEMGVIVFLNNCSLTVVAGFSRLLEMSLNPV